MSDLITIEKVLVTTKKRQIKDLHNWIIEEPDLMVIHVRDEVVTKNTECLTQEILNE